MEASIIVQIKEKYRLFSLLLFCYVLVGFVLNTAVCIWKGWIVWKWSDFIKGMETPGVFIPSADADKKPWMFSTFEKQVTHI